MASTGRQISYALVATFLFLLLLEGGLNWTRALGELLRDANAMQEAKHTEYDADLGWKHLANFHNPALYGPGRAMTTNGQRLRGRADDYAAKIPDARYRIVVLGDSFTMGFGVGDADTYPARLEETVAGAEVINMGMGGFGIGQDYLWYLRDGVQFETNLLVFAFIDHDFDRIGMTDFLGYPKPRVQLRDGKLVASDVAAEPTFNWREVQIRGERFAEKLAITSALRRLLPRPPKPEPGSLRAPLNSFAPVAEAMFSELAALSRKRGQDFALVRIPTNAPGYEERRAWLAGFAARTEIPFIDLATRVEQMSDEEREPMFIPRDGHLSRLGNRWLAGSLADELAARLEHFPARNN